MDAEPDGLVRQVGDSARRFLAAHHNPARARHVRRGQGGIDPAFWSGVAEQGWLALRLPEALGGAGLGLEVALELAACFGEVLVPDPFVEAGLMPGALLANLPPGEAIQALAEALSSGERTMSVAWQHDTGDLAVRPDGVQVVRDGTGVRLNGKCVFVPGPVDTVLVAATLDGAPCIAAVEGEAITWQPMRLADGGTCGHVTLDGAPGRILGHGIAAAEVAVREATLATASLLTALASAALADVIGHMKRRRQFDEALSAFQVNRHRLVDLHIQLLLAGASRRRALDLYYADPLSQAAARAIGAAKARASDTALTVTRAGIQYYGAMGYTEEADIGLYLRAALRHAAAFGNASAHRARHLALSAPEPVA